MSSKQYAAPLSLELRPSRSLSWLLYGTHAIAIGALWGLPFPWPLAALTTVPVLMSLRSSLGRHAKRSSASALRSMRWDANDVWHLTRCDGSETKADLQGDSFVHPALTVLNFRVAGTRRRESAVIMPDTLAVDPFRKLRVRLKLDGRNSVG